MSCHIVARKSNMSSKMGHPLVRIPPPKRKTMDTFGTFVSKETKETWWTDPAKCSDACGLWQRTWNADWDGRGPPVGEKMKASGAIRHLYLDSMLRRVLFGIVLAPFCWVGGNCTQGPSGVECGGACIFKTLGEEKIIHK